MKKSSTTRNSNIELLRIISTMMVLILHCLGSSGALEYITGSQYWFYWWMEAASEIAVNVFVIISGYFMVESRFKAQNVVKVGIGGVWLYSVVFSLISMYVADGQISVGGALLRAIFPLLTKKFWFVNSYLAMYILSPFINKMIKVLSKKQFTALTLILICMFSLRVTALPITWAQDSTGGMGLLWFLTLYCVSAWIRLNYLPNGKTKWYLTIYFAATVLLVSSKKVLLCIGVPIDYTGKLFGYPSIIVLIEAVSLFLVFLNMKPITGRVGQIICTVAKHSFSVYIIHFSVVNILFTKIIPVDRFLDNTWTGIVAIMLSVILVYSVCILIDYMKVYLFSLVGRRIGKTKLATNLKKMCDAYDNCVNG